MSLCGVIQMIYRGQDHTAMEEVILIQDCMLQSLKIIKEFYIYLHHRFHKVNQNAVFISLRWGKKYFGQ